MINENIAGEVVITSASSVLGEATARLLAAPSANVVLGARRGESQPVFGRRVAWQWRPAHAPAAVS